MQALAAEFNLSETTFVLPPADPANTARVRIFNRKAEMPFAGHPNVGTGWVLAGLGRARQGVLRFEEIAGLVEVRAEAGQVTIAAPQPLKLGREMAVELAAPCIGVAPADVVTRHHRPVEASVGNPFLLVEVTAQALAGATPSHAAFQHAVRDWGDMGGGRLSIYLYAHDGNHVRTRMFSPLSGTVEDAATGSAATPLAALLLSLGKQNEGRYDIVQGVEMGRPSRLLCTAKRGADGIRATVGGSCVPVLKGELSL
jgi:trans-2,3-dihydro-3-hydroxyanthranilate isomerase